MKQFLFSNRISLLLFYIFAVIDNTQSKKTRLVFNILIIHCWAHNWLQRFSSLNFLRDNFSYFRSFGPLSVLRLKTTHYNIFHNLRQIFNHMAHIAFIVIINVIPYLQQIILRRTLIINSLPLVDAIDNYPKRVNIHRHIIGIPIGHSLIHISQRSQPRSHHTFLMIHLNTTTKITNFNLSISPNENILRF